MQKIIDQAKKVASHWHEFGPEYGFEQEVDQLTRMLEESFPRIVCLCGSTRFWRTFQEAGLRETLAKKIVLSIGAASGTDDDHFGNLPKAQYDAIKEDLDQLHLRKIELADEILVLNVDGYIGPSTARELGYARRLGKVIRFWEDERGGA